MAPLLFDYNKHLHMKKIMPAFALLVVVTLFNSCSAIEAIFKAGFWAGLLFVAVIVGIVLFILANVFKKK
jgi:hypothetical protein